MLRQACARALKASTLPSQQAFQSFAKQLSQKPAWNRFLTSQVRAISTTSTTLATPASSSDSKPTTTDAAPAPTTLSSIVDRFGGWYPLAGLGAALIVSKEFLVLNEELLMTTNFAAMFATLYVVLGDTLVKSADEERIANAKRLDEVTDMSIEASENLLQAHKLNMQQVEVLKELKSEYNTLAEKLVVAKEMTLRKAAHDDILKRLSDIQGREAGENAMKKQTIADKTVAHVRRQWAKASAAEKNRLIDHAIARLEGSSASMGDNPVQSLFTNYLRSKEYEKEIAADKQARENARR